MLFLGAAGLLLVGAIVAISVLLSGLFTTAATKQHFRVTHRVLDLGLEYSVRRRADDIAVPVLDAPGMRELGAACYRAHCQTCHGAPGIAPDASALGMLPAPTNLAHVAREKSPQWLYYVTRKGVRMTGMPAWEYRLSDRSLWSVVAFVEELPTLDKAGYLRRSDASGGMECEPQASIPDPSLNAEVLLRQYGCHTCHRIDGVIGPQVDTGPPLVDWRRRGYIAGVLPNTRDNLVRWIVDPVKVSPQTLMPDLGVAPAHARAMADFLFAQQAGFRLVAGPGEPSITLPDADPERGRQHIASLQCGACHEVPGVRAARGSVGPTLEKFARRAYLAGKWPNEPAHLVRWLRDPPAMSPLTAMPAVVPDDAAARDIAAYLYTLE
jgi:mono/diheme cytochrome c family protein